MSREITHRMPTDGSGLTPCCGRTLFELPRTDRVALPWFSDEVTCENGPPVNLAAWRSLAEARQTIALMIAGLPVRELTPYEQREVAAFEAAVRADEASREPLNQSARSRPADAGDQK